MTASCPHPNIYISLIRTIAIGRCYCIFPFGESYDEKYEEAVGTGQQQKADTRNLQIEVGHGKKAIVIFVPVPILGLWHKSQQRLTRELEKKFSDRHVLIIASRRILPRPKRSNRSRTALKQQRPRSRTLTAVHDAILTDLVYPVEIVGKRVRTREDGSKLLKVVLDEKERGGVDYRLDTYSEVYKRLTGKGVNFEFPQSVASDY
ncbi:ribosomal protein S7e [Eremomyces bilateralis CBS 781.70]|uniref:40S ribosomal protein S7 n=1 Tax=Eremomyces bilateralis CBS 781.70 TaxID=1392243 RepID=A0A6G1GEW4_9PEZI|nr:ribosomal protein S7e [Eremomyces bilateralis CBS 781.70]KAF1816409.1 ribosomal protein S7e [Eremomyces bilateralis CBS 781.70]